MKAKPRTLLSFLCALLFLIATTQASGQNPTPSSSPSQLTPEEKALLAEAVALSRRIVELHGARKFDEALPLARRAIELRSRVLGQGSALVAESISNLGALYVAKDDYERAGTEFRTALQIYENRGVPTQNMGYVLDTLALLRWRVGDYDKAEAYAKKAMEIKEKVHGEQTPQFLESVNNLVKIYDSAGKSSQRNALLLRVIAVLETAKDTLNDRQSLIRYYCSLRQGKQTPEIEAMTRRIEALLKWEPAKPSPMSVGVLNGRAISLPRPPYPYEARTAHESGTVVVEVEIDECGNVASAKAVSGPGVLRKVCESAAKAARFTPTIIDGTPIRVMGVIQYHFVAQ